MGLLPGVLGVWMSAGSKFIYIDRKGLSEILYWVVYKNEKLRIGWEILRIATELRAVECC